MKQLHHTTGYGCFDLTECKLNRLVDKDGTVRFIVAYPKKWTEGERTEMGTPSGNRVNMRPYFVTEWEEVELEVKQ